jgi:isopenicillin N synthase-like dioxygenase
MRDIPVIDVSPLVRNEPEKLEVARKLGEALRTHGFFYVSHTGIDLTLIKELEASSREFFSRPLEEKMVLEMKKGGKAWRGYFPVGGELTSGKPDVKEGLYFGAELDPITNKGLWDLPLHGANLFPEKPLELKALVLNYMNQVMHLGHHLMRGLSLSLGLSETYFEEHYTKDPFILFRIFNYPLQNQESLMREEWGVGEHTDYGLLTILYQDASGGLEVYSGGEWLPAPPREGTFICNIGDMLEKATGGLYKSTPHRVRNVVARSRLSFPFFFDPNFFAHIKPIQGRLVEAQNPRWDKQDPHLFSGTYGNYLEFKISKVFPELFKSEIR